jgi:hypothetical protein
MSEALSSLRAPIDPGRGGVLLANMLASWLDHDPSWAASAEARDESEDSRTSPQQAGLHLSVSGKRDAFLACCSPVAGWLDDREERFRTEERGLFERQHQARYIVTPL